MNEWIVIGGLIIIILLITVVSSRINSLENQVKSLREIVNQVADQLDVPEHPINGHLRELLKEGKNVQAIKEAREAFGLSLIDAKHYVDKL